jgi:hypothetical protein
VVQESFAVPTPFERDLGEEKALVRTLGNDNAMFADLDFGNVFDGPGRLSTEISI